MPKTKGLVGVISVNEDSVLSVDLKTFESVVIPVTFFSLPTEQYNIPAPSNLTSKP